MYNAFFGLKRDPFSIAPDPRLLFMSERHREALAHLIYGVKGGGGFVLLTGEIGTGKTTVCRSFLDQLPAECNLAYIFNPKLTVPELLETVCHEFRVELPPTEGPRTVKAWVDALNDFLLRAHGAGRNNVLVIDEAQNVSADVLEQLRLLTNLETSERKLLQIILIGQPELREMLERPELEQLAQRVIARYHLQALSAAETAQYIRHRMEVCGLERPLPFDRGALARIHKLTGGVPRRINLLCDRTLLGAFATGQGVVGRSIVDKAAGEVFGERPAGQAGWRRPAVALSLGLAAGAGLLAAAAISTREAPRPAAAETARPAAAPAVKPAPAASAAMAAPHTQPTSQPATQPATQPPVLLTDEAQAWRELARAWKVTPGEGRPCEALEREGVQCFARSRLNLALIRQLDRPGVVTLDAGSSRPSYAILTSLGETSATLRAGGSEQTVTLQALAERWQGDYATLWRSPEGYKPRVPASATDWLARKLAAAKGTQPAQGAALKAEIRAFQVAQGLPADGAPGPLTFMQLNRLAGVEEPRLGKLP